MVFTSGIVDECWHCSCLRFLVLPPALVGGVEPGVGVGGGWCGALLGPEGSAGPLLWGCVLVASGSSLGPGLSCVGGRGVGGVVV